LLEIAYAYRLLLLLFFCCKNYKREKDINLHQSIKQTNIISNIIFWLCVWVCVYWSNLKTMGKEKCELVGTFSFIVQIMLGVLSFLVLIGKTAFFKNKLGCSLMGFKVKRYREKPKRQWKIWALVDLLELVKINDILTVFLCYFKDTSK